MTANEAKNISNNADMHNIYALIIRAALNNKNDVTIDVMTDKQTMTLRNNGYSVTYKPDDRDGLYDYWLIQW